jgi:hypothetical protein
LVAPLSDFQSPSLSIVEANELSSTPTPLGNFSCQQMALHIIIFSGQIKRLFYQRFSTPDFPRDSSNHLHQDGNSMANKFTKVIVDFKLLC